MQRPEFVSALRTALMQIDDVQSLRRSPLLAFLVRDRELNPMSLQRTLIEGIESLKSAPDVHAAPAYEILYYRYIEQLGQEELSYQLGMSVRQLRRKQADAIEYLATHLWERFHLGEPASDREADTPPPAVSNKEVGLQKEVAWLQRGFPPEAGDVRAELTYALQAAGTLAQHYHVALHDGVPVMNDRVAVPPIALRQALLAVLTCAITRSPGQEITVTAQATPAGPLLTV
ncbi:MAG: hypothetical protein IT330_13725, partial [Anaerolineae bacterium]|nr:hypothetical protein [Anaerolineae bacterium]